MYVCEPYVEKSIGLWSYIHSKYALYMMKKSLFFLLRPNSPTPLTDDWKVTDNSSVNFHEVFFFIFCLIIAKNEEKHVMEIYG